MGNEMGGRRKTRWKCSARAARKRRRAGMGGSVIREILAAACRSLQPGLCHGPDIPVTFFCRSFSLPFFPSSPPFCFLFSGASRLPASAGGRRLTWLRIARRHSSAMWPGVVWKKRKYNTESKRKDKQTRITRKQIQRSSRALRSKVDTVGGVVIVRGANMFWMTMTNVASDEK